jgi:GT2 family glycosyltransferase
MTVYPGFEIIVLDSERSEAIQETIEQIGTDGITLKHITLDSPFRYSVANNRGADTAEGQLLLFLNDDVEIIERDWLSELVRWAALPEIGVVGAKLLYPDRSIQHYGVILGMGGHANHVFQGVNQMENGPFGSTNWYRNYLAVTGACMMVNRTLYEGIGGFDEKYQLAFSDIDFCLRVIEQGFRVMLNPFARLIHHEGATRGRYMPFKDLVLARQAFLPWLESGDPYFSPNLSYQHAQPRIAYGKHDRVARLDEIIRNAERKENP